MREAFGVAIPAKQAEQTLRVLRRLQIIDRGLEFARNQEKLFVPLLRLPSEQDIARIREDSPQARIEEHLFRELREKPRSLIEYLREEIPDRFLSSLTRSYDTVGDIAIIELSPDLIKFSTIIGKGLLELSPHLRLVLRKSGEVAGPYRTREYEIIAGGGNTETFHKEFSCLYHLDITKVYFNPRLSNERMRIARQVKPRETVLDMFTGVGPYAILIARTQPTSTVNAADINADAIRYLNENILINRVADRVAPILDDARRVSAQLQGRASRVVMNLPSQAQDFLREAAQAVKAEGGTIHYYTFASRNDNLDTMKESLRQNVRKTGREVRSFTFCDVIREIAPNRVQVAVDILLK